MLQLRNDPDAGDGVSQSQPDASKTGSELRARREAFGWSLEQMAERLCIRRVFLEAIEGGRLNDLPGAAYAVAFVRSYASALELDAEEIARRFREEAAAFVGKKSPLVFPQAVPERGIPAGRVVLVALTLGLCGYVGWYLWTSTSERVTETVPPVPAQIAVQRPPTPHNQPAPVTPMATASTPAVPPPATQAAPLAPPAAAAFPPFPAPAAPAPVVVTGMPAATAEAAASAPPAGVSVEEIGRLVIRARSDAWVQVRDRQGSVVLDRVLKSGETWVAPQDNNGLVLTTGNAGGTEISLNGQVLVPSLGALGSVRRGVLLDADRLRELPPVPQNGAPRPGQ